MEYMESIADRAIRGRVEREYINTCALCGTQTEDVTYHHLEAHPTEDGVRFHSVKKTYLRAHATVRRRTM